MSHSPLRRAVALAVAAGSLCLLLPAAASAKRQDLKVMTRNLYLGTDLIPLAAARNREEFEQNAEGRYQTVLRNDFATRAKPLAAELARHKPDLVGINEGTTWRTGPKDGDATKATDVLYDSIELLLEELAKRGEPYRVVVGRDWLDFEGPTTQLDARITQNDTILVRRRSKVKIRRAFRGGFRNTFDPPTVVGTAVQDRGYVAVDGTLAGRRFRFVNTHLEAYNPDTADLQMKELLAAGGPLASKRRQSILMGDFNSAPTGNVSDRGTSRDASAYYSAIEAGFRNPIPRRATCCFAEDLNSTAESLETWIDHIIVRPRIRRLRSGLVGTQQIGGIYPSDHAGVWATLRLR